MVAMDDSFAIIVTCTPHPRILTLFIMAPWSIVRYVVLTLWLQVQVQVWFSIPVIVLFCCLSLIPGFCLTQSFMSFLITLGALTSRLETG